MKIEKKLEKNITLIKEVGISFVAIILMTLIVGLFTYILNRPVAEILRNTITFLWGMLMLIFLWYQSVVHNNLEYDNKYHPLRFLIVFLICFAISMGIVFAPVSVWVFLSIMVVLAMEQW